jgi:hypothetical protein
LGEYNAEIYEKLIALLDQQIKKYSQKGEYEKVAPYLREGLLLAPQHEPFVNMNQLLQTQAQVWVNEIPKFIRDQDFIRAQHYYKIGEIYLKPEDLADVKKLIEALPK